MHFHTWYIGQSLLWVAALGLVVLYIYAVVSFAFLHESFQAPDNDDATLFCSTLYECFVSTIRYGLIENLGLVRKYVYYSYDLVLSKISLGKY